LSLKKILITVKTYPLPSRTYDELVCIAGIDENKKWVRIYPVPFSFLKFQKYQWIELSLKPRRKGDPRPESYTPVKPELADLKILEKVDTKNNWEERKKYCLNNVYEDITELIEVSRAPQNISLATFKPKQILDLIIENDEREWNPKWIEQLKQLDIFTKPKNVTGLTRTPISKLPYKFKYLFVDGKNNKCKLMIEDWEIGALYWNCLRASEGDEKEALRKVKEKYLESFIQKDVYLFLGTTLEWHLRKAKNPFVIIGVFYPSIAPKEKQMKLFT